LHPTEEPLDNIKSIDVCIRSGRGHRDSIARWFEALSSSFCPSPPRITAATILVLETCQSHDRPRPKARSVLWPIVFTAWKGPSIEPMLRLSAPDVDMNGSFQVNIH